MKNNTSVALLTIFASMFFSYANCMENKSIIPYKGTSAQRLQRYHENFKKNQLAEHKELKESIYTPKFHEILILNQLVEKLNKHSEANRNFPQTCTHDHLPLLLEFCNTEIGYGTHWEL